MWKTLCYEVSGSLKEDNSLPCQDKTIATNIDEVNVICLSSGDVSSKVSHFGADLITKISSEYFSKNFDTLHALETQDLNLKLYTFLHENVTKHATSMNVNFTDLAATMCIVAVKGDKYISCSLGDSVVCCFKEKKIRVMLSNTNVDLAAKFVTSENALGAIKTEVGILKGINGFAMVSAATAKCLHFKYPDSFSMIMSELIKTTGAISEAEMFEHITKVCETFVVHKNDKNCSVAIMSAPKCASRYHALSNLEKLVFLKLSTHDENSLPRVKDLDNILYIIDDGKSVTQLTEILKISETNVKKKLEILVKNNILSLNSSDVYKKNN